MSNPTIVKGNLVPTAPTPAPPRLGIVVSRFNEFLTRALLEGTLDTLERHGIPGDSVTVVWVPGAWEISLAAARLVAAQQPAGLIALGAVIRGQTPHFDYVAGHACRGVAALGESAGIPVGMGILTTDTIDQATERVGVKMGNKGSEAALAVLEMLDVLRQIDGLGGGGGSAASS